MFKNLKSFFLCATLLLSPSLFAGTFAGYRDDCNPCCNSWKVDVEFLYFMPTFDDTYFVIQNPVSTSTAMGQRLNNDFHFKPGFRVGAGYEFNGCCEGELWVYYTRLNASQARTVSGGRLFATLGSAEFASDFEDYVGTASSHLDCLYQRVDAFYAKHLWCDRCLIFDGFFGLEYAYLRLTGHYVYNAGVDIGTLNQRSRTWGIGPQFGFDFNYLICQISRCCPGTLSLATSTSGSLLVSKSTIAMQDFINSVVDVNVSDENTWRIIPALHARVGLNYATCFSCWRASLEVGYEFTSYIRGLSREIFYDDVANIACLTNYYNFDVQGLYVALNVAF